MKKDSLHRLDRLLRPPMIDQTPPAVRAAREDFFAFCALKNPKFYKRDRTYLVTLCRELQKFYESDDPVCIVCLPPRHGKSYTASNLSQWIYGQNPAEKIMTGSYNEMLSQSFARSVRNGIAEQKADKDVIVYSDIFPGTRIARGEAGMKMWSIDGYYSSYLATSPSGTATGFGASLIIIDDLIKNAYEAFSAPLLDKQWAWFTDTMLSRLEEGGKIIIIMTRWARKDLAGRAIDHFDSIGVPVRKIVMPAVQQDGSMLCPAVLSRKSYEIKTATMSPEIASANYNQIPIDLKGTLYKDLKTYDRVPTDASGHPLFTDIRNYTDTADTGSDWLCTIVYGVYNKEAYILDLLYTKDGMEVTEGKTAKLLHDTKCRTARIESNNGGRIFARNVERELKEKYANNLCIIQWFHQSQNKMARILSHSAWVMQHVYFPANWRNRWPEFYRDVTEYQKEGQNAHDDAPDTLTGIAEDLSRPRRTVGTVRNVVGRK